MSVMEMLDSISTVEGQPLRRKPWAKYVQYLASSTSALAAEACTGPSLLFIIAVRERIASVMKISD